MLVVRCFEHVHRFEFMFTTIFVLLGGLLHDGHATLKDHHQVVV